MTTLRSGPETPTVTDPAAHRAEPTDGPDVQGRLDPDGPSLTPTPSVAKASGRELSSDTGRRPGPWLRVVAGTFTLIALLMLGFVAYLFGLSGLSESRSQVNTFKSFRATLDQAVAPVGPVRTGTPVAILDIPAIGVRNLVVREGTDARTMTMGPGHRRDTPLPGQAGVVVLFGRRATFGAPFAHLLRLNPGDHIRATTGQGVADYVVSSFGTGSRPAPANSVNRLVLTTADSAFAPKSTVSVSADLRSRVVASGGQFPQIGPDEKSMTGASDRSLLPLALWAQVLLISSVLATLGAHRWSRWPTWWCATPVLLAVLWNVYENAASLLPNVF